jgi:hypothetical protein
MRRRTELSPVDVEACERALEIARSSGPDKREQIDQLLAEDGWSAAADLAVYHSQRELIRPRLWQPTPADIDPADIDRILAAGDDHLAGEFQAARLLKKMLKAGLSRYEPRPIEALQAKRRQSAAPEPEAAV